MTVCASYDKEGGFWLMPPTCPSIGSAIFDAGMPLSFVITSRYVTIWIRLSPDPSVRLILIKANVCEVLEPKLAKNRFNVLNRGTAVFPSHGRQVDFHHQFGSILEKLETDWLPEV